jgi:ABC-type transport system substrate-binding protein
VIAKEAVDYYGTEFPYNPVGTGPYKVDKWIRESKVVFVRNVNFNHLTYPEEGTKEDKINGLLNDAGKKLPFIDKIVMYILVEEQPRWLNFKRGNIDIVEPDKDNYYDAFPVGGELSEDLKRLGVRVLKRLETTIRYNAFNMRDSLVGKNKYLRQAISAAYDAQKHNALFYNNQAVVANWIIAPDIFGYDPLFRNPYRHNLEKAKKLLAKAGYPNGEGLPPLNMLILDSIASRQIGEFFAKSMSDIGISIVLKPDNFGLHLKTINSGKGFQLFTLKWSADLPIVEDFLQILYSKAYSPGPNHSQYSNRKYDLLFEKVSQMKPGPEKLKLVYRMRDIASEDCPILPTAYPMLIHLTHRYVENYKPHLMSGYRYKYLKINKSVKKNVQNKLNRITK